MKPQIGISMILFAIISSSLLTACGAINEVTETSNYSYDLGYDLGISGSIGRTHFWSGDTAKNICSLVYEMSITGTPNDNINWSAVVESDFTEGCIEGTKQAHPGADWIE